MSPVHATADEVEHITLTGAPRSIVVDAAALGPAGHPDGARARHLLAALGLDVKVVGRDAIDPTVRSVAVLGRPSPPIEGCNAWFVGAGPAPAWMHATDGGGPRTTAQILSLLVVGFAQVRASAAFIAAGTGRPVPDATPYDCAAVLAGITAAVTTPHDTAAAPTPPLLDDALIDALLRSSLALLDRCCAPSGAIAAAPRPGHAGEPDYWFFWQRDAAHATCALHQLSIAAPDAVGRAQARARVDGYVRFVTALGEAVARTPGAAGISRTSMDGEPIDGYGNPQPDGPAATALAILTVVADPRAALAIARPFLTHLVEHAPVGYDLWELTVGTSFYAVNLARRALSRAAALAGTVGDPHALRYAAAAAWHADLLERFRDGTTGGVVSTLEPQPSWWAWTSRLDVSVIGSTLLAGADTGSSWGADDPAITSTLHALERSFAPRWPVNAAWRAAGHRGIGLGRFPEDGNDGLGTSGGHPWPIATLWAARLHHRRAQRATDGGVRAEALAQGDGYLGFVLAHTDPAAISEQIDGATGRPRGAAGLAWAHAELVAALLACREAHDQRGDRSDPDRASSGE